MHDQSRKAMRDDFSVDDGSADRLLEIFVETLMGTVFEMTLSSLETIANIKLRLQRLEGIPRQQMHLLFMGQELPDSSTLSDCGVQSGATLRLILALRGGPINTRRVPLGHHHHHNHNDSRSSREDHSKEDRQRHGQLTFLVFRDGDQVNFYHVMERDDGSYSPISGNWSTEHPGALMLCEGTDPEEQRRLKENAVTMSKMSELKMQLENMSLAKREKKFGRRGNPRTESSGKKRHRRRRSSRQQKSNNLANSSLKGSVVLPPIRSKGDQHDEDADGYLSSTTSIVALDASVGVGAHGESSRELPHLIGTSLTRSSVKVPEWLHEKETITKHPGVDSGHHNDIFSVGAARHDSASRLITANVDPIKDMQRPIEVARRRRNQRRLDQRKNSSLSSVNLSTNSSTSSASRNLERLVAKDDQEVNSKLFEDNDNARSLETSLDCKKMKSGTRFMSASSLEKVSGVSGRRSRNRESGCSQRSNLSGSSKPLGESSLDGVEGVKDQHADNEAVPHTRPTSRPVASSSQKRSFKSARPTFATSGPGTTSQKVRKKTPRPRCYVSDCRKKLNITSGFPCRCQRVFCAKHRHPEFHDCPFDYKQEGRKLLQEKTVPAISFPKLPKI